MVVGDDDFNTQAARFFDAVDTGDAVVDSDDDVGGLLARGKLDDFRRQAIAVLESVRHDVVDLGAKQAQATQRNSAGGRAIAVVVGHDHHALVGGNGVGQENGCCVDVQQAARYHQRLQFAR